MKECKLCGEKMAHRTEICGLCVVASNEKSRWFWICETCGAVCELTENPIEWECHDCYLARTENSRR